MLISPNVLKGTYDTYRSKCLLRRWVGAIPKWRRKSLAQEIRAGASILGCQDQKLLEAVIKLLEGEKQVEKVIESQA